MRRLILFTLLLLVIPRVVRAKHKLTYDFYKGNKRGLTVGIPTQDKLFNIGFASDDRKLDDGRRYTYELYTDSCYLQNVKMAYGSFGFYAGVGLLVQMDVDIIKEDILTKTIKYPEDMDFNSEPYLVSGVFITVWYVQVSHVVKVKWKDIYHYIGIGGSF